MRAPRHKVRCAVCGKGRFHPSDNVRVVFQPTRFTKWGYEQGLAEAQIPPDDIITLEPGAFVCWYHEPLPPLLEAASSS